MVHIGLNRRQLYLGTFADFFSACCVRAKAEELVGSGATRDEVLSLRESRQHGRRHTKEYKAWACMLERCTRSGVVGFENYGGRGIRVCDRWLKFQFFYDDMGPCPDGFSLDRIDVDGNYEPGNCRWADKFTQARNTRLRKANKSGINGVWWDTKKGKYVVKMNHEGRVRHFGTTDDFFEACCIRKSAEALYR